MPPATALGAAVAAALGHQDGYAPLYAALAAIAGRPGVPAGVAGAAAALLGLRLAVDGPPTPAAVRAALARSGLFHEAAGGAVPDLKGALIALRAALAHWLDEIPHGAASVAAPVPRERPPPPPRRGGSPAAQPAAGALAELLAGLDDAALAAETLDAAERALSRLLLHQAASLDRDDGAPPVDADVPPGLVFELPLAGPGGTSVAEVRIERDRHRRAPGEPDGPTWRVEIECAVGGIGPLAARIGLMPGRRIVIGLWCEDPAAVPRLEAERSRLEDALRAAGLDVAGLDLRIGRPPARRTLPGHLPQHRLDLEL